MKKDEEAADSKDTQLSEEMQREAEERKELAKKKRVDDLWADFLKDTSSPLSQPKPKSSSVSTQSKVELSAFCCLHDVSFFCQHDVMFFFSSMMSVFFCQHLSA